MQRRCFIHESGNSNHMVIFVKIQYVVPECLIQSICVKVAKNVEIHHFEGTTDTLHTNGFFL